jgi:hypothetical protein
MYILQMECVRLPPSMGCGEWDSLYRHRSLIAEGDTLERVLDLLLPNKEENEAACFLVLVLQPPTSRTFEIQNAKFPVNEIRFRSKYKYTIDFKIK